MDIEDTLNNPGFWILAGGAVIAELIGFIISKKSTSLPAFPFWQFLILVFATIIIAALIAGRE